ncbi:alpha/beta hydrolase family protein [Paenibacillus tarimensis]
MKGIKARLKRVTEYDNRISISAMAGLQLVLIVVWLEIGAHMPTGLGLWADILFCSLVAVFGNAAIFLAGYVAAILLACIPIRLPRLLIGTAAGAMLIIPKALTQMNINLKGAFLLLGSLLITGIVIGLIAYIAVVKLLNTPERRRMTFTVAAVVLAACWFILSDFQSLQAAFSKIIETDSEEEEQWNAYAPSAFGSYSVQTFTYGSGTDLRRKEFGSGAQLISPSVDASGFITKWNKVRTLFWGFDPGNLPLNGRVWMPEGDGPFPVVLIVHGNHTMEDYSDAGYAYLGELLASRGFLTVSIDQNFVNYSVYSGIPGDDYALRAWLLLHHLKFIDEFSHANNNLLSGKADMDSIALIGHSRGGQAAALAAVYDSFFKEAGKEKKLAHIHYPIRSVVAIAPTDKKLENKYIKLNDINYLTLHGAKDSDVTTFDGDRQYDRVSFSRNSADYYFKSSLYIGNANHGQFNSSWGQIDIKLPLRWLMNTAELLSEQEQQVIAQTYISAFLETTLLNKTQYLPMFRDWRRASAWLPESTYINRFNDSRMLKVATFEEDSVKETATLKNTTIEGSELQMWEEQDKKNRQQGSRFNRAVLLSWGDRKGSFGIQLSRAAAKQLSSSSRLIFSLAHASTSALQYPMDFSIRITTVQGYIVSQPISGFRPIHPVVVSRYLNAGPLSDYIKGGKLNPSTEAVYQDYIIPLNAFIGKDSPYKPSHVAKIEWVFDRTTEGSIFIDDIYLQR